MRANRRTRIREIAARLRVRDSRAKRRTLALLIVAVVAAPVTGCATKRDVQQLRDEVVAMQARQDSLIAALDRRVTTALRDQSELVLRVRGDLGHQLMTMEQQLIQIQELSGQSQRRLTELREELESRRPFLSDPVLDPAGEPGTEPLVSDPAFGSPDALYEVGMEQLRRGAAGTARRAFQQLLDQHPTHERAPDAQYNIAEAYVLEGDFELAYREFDRVVERFPETPRAPAALYRAAIVAEDTGDTARAREYLQRVSAGYPRSDEARLARERLPDLPRR